MYRLSLIVTAVGLLLAGPASAGPRSNFPPQDGYWGPRYCLQGRTWGYPGLCQFSNLRVVRGDRFGYLELLCA